MISMVFETAHLSDEFALSIFEHYTDIVSLPIIRNSMHSVPLKESAVARAGYSPTTVEKLNGFVQKGGDYVIFHDGTNQVAVTNNENLRTLQQFQTLSGNRHPMNLLQETLVESYDVATGKIRCKVYVEDLSDSARGFSDEKVEIASFMNLKDYNRYLKDVIFNIREVATSVLEVTLDNISVFVLGVVP